MRHAHAGGDAELVGDLVGAVGEGFERVGLAEIGILIVLERQQRRERRHRQACDGGVGTTVHQQRNAEGRPRQRHEGDPFVGAEMGALFAALVKIVGAGKAFEAAAIVERDAHFLAHLAAEIILAGLDEAQLAAVAVKQLVAVVPSDNC